MNDWRRSLIAISICLVVGVAAVMTPWLVNSVYTRGASPNTTENASRSNNNNNNNANITAASDGDDDATEYEAIQLGKVLADPFWNYDAVLQYFGEPRMGGQGWWESLFDNRYMNPFTKDYQTGMVFSWDDETALKNGWVDDFDKPLNCGGTNVLSAHGGTIVELYCHYSDIKSTGTPWVDSLMGSIVTIIMENLLSSRFVSVGPFGADGVFWSTYRNASHSSSYANYYGSYMIIKYPDGRIHTVYGHLQQIPLELVLAGIIDELRPLIEAAIKLLLLPEAVKETMIAALSAITPEVGSCEIIGQIDQKNWWEIGGIEDIILKVPEYFYFEVRDSRPFNEKMFVWNPNNYFSPWLEGHRGTNFAPYKAIVYESFYEYDDPNDENQSRTGYHPKLSFESWMAGSYDKVVDPGDPGDPGDPPPPYYGDFISPIKTWDRVPESAISADIDDYVGHTGLDIAYGLSVGAEIVAVGDGKIVTNVKDLANDFNTYPDSSPFPKGNPYGNHVIIDHGNGMQTLYAHMLNNSASTLTVGNTVSAGEVIGRMGNTGNSSGPHLHIEVRRVNESGGVLEYLNPRYYLPIGDAPPSGGGAISYTDAELQLLARMVAHEAYHNLGDDAMLAVAAVVVNRVKSSEFPNTIYDVIYQSGQFCYTNESTGQVIYGFTETVAADIDIQIALRAINGEDPTNGYMYYWSVGYWEIQYATNPNQWPFPTYTSYINIGGNIFFRFD